VRDRAAELASAAGVTIEHLAKKHIRKEDVVAKILAVRGDHPGLVHIISAMEACNTYKPWHDKQTHRTFLRPDTGKCLHYYFDFIDAELGLIYLRVPTPACAGAALPSCASTTGSVRRPLPMASRPTCCVASSIAEPVLGPAKGRTRGPSSDGVFSPAPTATTIICGEFGINRHMVLPAIQSLPLAVHLRASNDPGRAAVADILRLLRNEVETADFGNQIVVRHLLSTLFVYVRREMG
jgi:Cupin